MNRTSSTKRALLQSARNRPLRGLGTILACFLVSEMGSWIAVTTVAHRFGGVHEAAAVMVAQLAPAAVVATVVGSLAQRWGERRVLQGGLAAQTAGLAGVAVLLAVPHPTSLAVYAAAVVASVAVVTTRPMVAAMLPGAVQDPRELATANAVFGWLDGAAALVGPLIAAICFASVGPWLAFAVFAVIAALAAMTSGRVGGAERITAEEAEPVALAVASRAARQDAGLRSVLVVLAACSFAVGALDLLYVVVAVDVLGGTDADAGLLNTAFGVGALVGGAAAVVLSRRRAIWPRVLTAAIVLAVGVAALGAGHHRAVAALLLAACGVGEAVLMISARTLLQRVADLRLLCHVFALAEASTMATLLLGALVVPLFVALFSARWAGIGIGVIVAVAVASGLRAMAAADRAAEAWIGRIPLLRSTELFSILPAPALETLARQATACAFSPGQRILVEGDIGDRYYVITKGSVAVVRGGQPLATRHAGEGFGEVALLRDVPRTATVTAIDDVELLSIDRTAFIVAVTGHAPTMRHATHDVAQRYIF
ncbi:MAG: hypothetical protein QOI55_248 [Actinomycetota bacterium]|nr:hypothetical protein [Actinomycetota bacterium]